MPCILTLDQATLSPAGVPGFSRSDGLAGGELVTITNTGGGETFEVELLWVPAGDTGAVPSLTQTGPNTWTFSPDASHYGRFRIKGTTDAGLPTESISIHTFGIRFPYSGLLPPAANELSDPSTTLATSTESSRIASSETNEPTADFAAGNPFGWTTELHRAFDAIEGLYATPIPIPYSSNTLATSDATPFTIIVYTPTDNTATHLRVRALVAKADLTSAKALNGNWGVLKNGGVTAITAVFGAVDSGGGLAAATVTAVASGGDILLRVTGIAATNLNWRVVVEFFSIAGP